MVRFFISAFFILLLSFHSFSIKAQGESEAEADAMLVLDASGSMWGQIEGKNKIVIAREVIAEMMETWPDNVALGLIAYGHREEGNCADIELMSQVAKGSVSKIPGIVNNLNPKGKTPLTDAVSRAADILKQSDRPGSIILVTDGLETCDADPCTLGKTLAEAGIDMKVHVVGFDLEGQDVSAIQCLASSTGGEYLTANTADELTEALGRATTQVKSTVQSDVIRLKLFQDSEEFVEATAAFQYFRAGPDGQPEGDYVGYGYGAEGHPSLSPGNYVAQIRLGGVENIIRLRFWPMKNRNTLSTLRRAF